MSKINHTPTPWGLCYHLRSPEHDASCQCGYRGSIWSADGDYIVCEMGSSPDVDESGQVQGHIMPMADRPTQLADAAFIVRAVNSHDKLVEALKAIRELSGLDHSISGASAVVMSRMADIHQHSDAALASLDQESGQ